MYPEVMRVKYTLSRAGNYARRVVETEVSLRNDKYSITALPKSIRDMMAQGWELKSWTLWVSSKKFGKAPKRKGAKAAKRKGSGANPQHKMGSKLAPKKYSSIPEWHGDAQKCADLISRIVGDGVKSRQTARYNVDVVGLAGSWEKGENPIDYLSKPVESVRKPILMISPDCSGSCVGFSAFTKGFAHILSKHYEVYYEENVNGWVDFCPEEVDLILYMGDKDFFSAGTDGEYTTHMEAEGRTSLCRVKTRVGVVGMDNYACTYGAIRTDKERSTASRAWITRVSLKAAKDYVAALEAAVKHFTR